MPEKTNSFWSSLPGALTGLAAVITAITGFYLAIKDDTPKLPQDTNQINSEPSARETSESSLMPATISSSHAGNATTQLPATQLPAPPLEQTVENEPPFPETGPLVDCKQFPAVNTIDSLMSWSDYYHKQILTANGSTSRAQEPCNRAIDYRGMAHCKSPANAKVRLAFLETLTLCRIAGIEWTEIQHTTIIGGDK